MSSIRTVGVGFVLLGLAAGAQALGCEPTGLRQSQVGPEGPPHCVGFDHLSEGHCCGVGYEWAAAIRQCACADAAVCGAGAARTQPVIATPRPVPPGTCPNGMVYVPGGTVTGRVVGAVCMDRTEVTVGAYRTCASCSAAATWVDWPGISAADRELYSPFCNGAREDRLDHPVNCVDWDQAAAYCASRGARLPTEWEWQLAAQGIDGRQFPWGNAAPDAQLCWGRWAPRLGTCPVGSYPAGDSPYGLADMAGDVWEWTSSPWEADPSLRVYRGGSWRSHDPSVVCVSCRNGDPTKSRNENLGFRCAAEPR